MKDSTTLTPLRSSPNGYKGQWTWDHSHSLAALRYADDLSHAAYRVAVELLCAADQNAIAKIGFKELTARCHCSRPGLTSAIQQLEDGSYIEVQRKHRACNIYRILFARSR